MNRLSLLLFAGFALCACATTDTPSSPAGRRPNVVIVLADDLGAGDLGCYNPDSKAPTPQLDRLALEGMRFGDAHSPSAVCTPTRYGLLTGRYAWRSRLKRGVLGGNSRSLIEPDRTTIGSLFATAGYDTACFGKWHLGLGTFDPSRPDLPADFTAPLDAGPHTLGFATSRIVPASLDMAPYLWVKDGVAEEAPSARTPGSTRRWAGGGGFWRAGPIAPGFVIEDVLHATCDDAVQYLESRKDRTDRPFLLYVALTAPHTPWVPDAEHRGASSAGWYGDFVAQVDTEVGRILTAIDAAGHRDDTLVIVTSDNGSHWRPQDVAEFEHDAHDGRRGMKADIHEAGHRVPMLVRWPGHTPEGTRSDALVSLLDLCATTADACGIVLPAGAAEDSRSFAPNLHESTLPGRDELVLHSVDGMFALRAGPWVLIDGLGSGGFTAPARLDPEPDGASGQLYDLSEDPRQARDRWLTEPERAEAMRIRLDAIRRGSQ